MQGLERKKSSNIQFFFPKYVLSDCPSLYTIHRYLSITFDRSINPSSYQSFNHLQSIYRYVLSTVSSEYHLRSWSGSVRRLEPFSLLHLFDKNTSEWLCGSTSILGSSGCSSIPCLSSALHLQASTQLSLSPFRRGETDQLLKQATTQRGNGQWNSSELCAPSDCMANEFCPAVSKGSPQKKHRLGHWAPFWSLVAAAQWHPSSSVFSPWRSYVVIL